jgi:hypothetical protein
VDSQSRIGEQLHDAIEFSSRQVGEGFLQVVHQRLGEVSLHGWRTAAPELPRRRLLGQRRTQLRRQFLAKAALEVQVRAKAEPGHQAQDARRTDADSPRKIGRALQACHRVLGKQLVGHPALGRRKVIEALAQLFNDRPGHPPLQILQLDNIHQMLEL